MEKQMSKYKDLIQPFLDGELSREELDWISKELESNAVLADDIKLYREVDSAIREQDVMGLRNQLEVIHNSLDESTRNPKRVPRYRKAISYAAIASLAILISVGVLYKIQTRKLSNVEIYEKYYEPYDVTMVYRSAGDNTDMLYQEARLKYEAGEFREAITLFEKLLESDPADMATTLYSGISYMEVEQYNQADKSFSKIIAHDDNLFIEQAEWYLGFCYLMTNETGKARKHFEKIAGSNSSYRDKAASIINKIK
jgi:tetratricopeptide (TPR) repeat protein